MINLFTKIADIIDALNEWVGRTIAWLTLAMVIVTLLVVIMRYGFDFGRIAMQESIIYMHALLFMGAAAYTLKHEAHVRVDIFYQRFSPRTRHWVDIIGTVFLLFPVCGFILWSSTEYVINAWQLMEGSREAGGLPLVYLLKSYIPLLAILLLLQGVSMLCRKVIALQGGAAD